MSTGNEKFEFDVESGKLKKAIDDVHARLKSLYWSMASMGKDSKNWTDAQFAAYGQLGQQVNAYKQQLNSLKNQYAAMMSGMVQQQRMYAQSTRDLNVIFMSLGYAIDDFLTVWSMRTDSIEGILAGAGAAANNFSVILAQILPGQTKLLAFLPVLAVAVAKVGYSFYKTGEDAELSAEKIQQHYDHVKKLQEEIDAMNAGKEKAAHERRRNEDFAQRDIAARELDKIQAEKNQAMMALARDHARRRDRGVLMDETAEKEERETAKPFDQQIEAVKNRIRIIDQAVNQRDQKFAREADKKTLEQMLRSSGADELIVKAIQGKLKQGQKFFQIQKQIIEEGPLKNAPGDAGIDVFQDLFQAAKNQAMKDQMRKLAEEAGPQTIRLDKMKRREEDLREEIDILKTGRPGEMRAPHHVIQAKQQEMQNLQQRILKQERLAEQEKELSKDGTYIGEKLDRIAELFHDFLLIDQNQGVPLPNPQP